MSVVLIPARLQSTRLPNKPLADIAGKPMVWHVWQQALASQAERVVIATDSQQIVDVMQSYGADVVLTSDQHTSGTERLAEACQLLGLSDDTPVVNVQGDEPLIRPEVINQVLNLLLAHPQVNMATLCEPIERAEQLVNPNIVKVVRNQQGMALTFSRSPIPWHRDAFGQTLNADQALPADYPCFRHLGIYAYRAGFLHQYVQWPVCAMEQIEALEQLRVLWHGEQIVLAEALVATQAGVDTAEDLERVRQILVG